LALPVKTCAALRAIVGDVQEQRIDPSPRESFVRHPTRAAAAEAAHFRQVADEGESPETLAIVVAVVLAFLVPLVASLIALTFVIAYFA
jgi:hypothetical protein